MKRILFFVLSGAGGAEKNTVNIAKMLPLDEFEPIFIVVGKTKGVIANYIPDKYKIRFLRLRNVWDFTTFRFYHIIRKEKPYKVFCSVHYLNPRCIIAAKMAGVKSVIRSSNILQRCRWDVMLLLRHTYKHAQYVISQQDMMREQLIEKLHLNPQKVITIQNLVDTDIINQSINVPSPYPLSPHIKLLWTARIAPQKGQDILIKALKIIRTEVNDAHLYLVGPYDENSSFYKKVVALIQEMDLNDYVHILGFDMNPYKWMRYCDCFVLPSRYEGLPNALIEASYLNRNLAASRCIPIISEIVKDGVNGFTANPEDPESLAEAVIKSLRIKSAPVYYKGGEKEDFINLFR